MKDIKEFIHYYLGQQFMMTKPAYHAVHEFGLSSDTPFAMSGKFADYFHGDAVSAEVKPILRKLESMTEDEANECWKLLEWNERINPANRASEIIREFSTIEEDNGTTNNAHWGYFLKILPYLLSRGFDLFNLIDEGLAIDKETLKG